VTKKSKRADHLPRLRRAKQRRVFTTLMLGLDDMFRTTLGQFEARYVLEMRHVFQRVMACHLKGETATAHEIGKHSGLARMTVQRILDDLIDIGWLEHDGSHYWLSRGTAKLPVMPRSAYAKGTKLVIDAAKELQSKRKKIKRLPKTGKYSGGKK
jgi:hypothetical protein